MKLEILLAVFMSSYIRLEEDLRLLTVLVLRFFFGCYHMQSCHVSFQITPMHLHFRSPTFCAICTRHNLGTPQRRNKAGPQSHIRYLTDFNSRN